MRSILTIFAVTLTTFSAYGVDVERLLNPGFEDGVLDPWATDGWVLDETDPHDGTYCVFAGTDYYIEQAFDPIDVVDITSITYWVKQPQGMYTRTDVYYGASDYDNIFRDVYTNNWVEVDITQFLRVYGNVEKICIWGFNDYPPDDYYLDDVSVIYEDGTAAVESASLGNIKATFK